MTHLPIHHTREIMPSLWSATRFFLTTLPNKVRKDYFLALFFYKVICDEWREGNDALHARFPDIAAAHSQVRAELVQAGRWHIPASAQFETLAASFHLKGLGKRIDQALLTLEECNPDKLKGLFGDLSFDYAPIFAPLDGDVLLQTVMNALGQAELSMRPSRFLDPHHIGQCFSELVEQFMLQCRPAPLLCPTPIRVAQLMATLLAPEPDDVIYDPACGTGALLVACGQWVQQRFARRECRLLGQDYSYDALRLARMQLLLHRLDNHRLLHGESLNVPLHGDMIHERLVLPQVDIAVCHPPELLPAQWFAELWQDPYEQFAFGTPTEDSASLAFVLHMLACLKPDTGRMAALLPRSIFSNRGNDQAILHNLLQANCIEGVICLPGWLFAHPDQPQVLMLLRHKRQDNRLCWLDVSAIAPDNTAILNRLPEFFRLGRDVPGYVRMVTHQDIKATSYRWDFQP